MSQPHKIEITNAKWDRYARTTTTIIDQKQILTPCFVVHVKNLIDFSIYRDERSHNNELNHCGICLMPYYLGTKTVQPLLKAIDQRTLSGEYVHRPFIESTVFAYDPFVESMVSSGKYDDIEKSALTPKPIVDYFKKIERAKKRKTIDNVSKYMREKNEEFWNDLLNDSKMRNNMILTDFENGKQMGANMYLTRVPFIDSVNSFEIWKEFDASGKVLWNDGLVATYLPCSNNLLYDSKLLNEVINFITEDNTPITVLKIKELNLTDPEKHKEFENYKLLLEQVNGLRMAHPEKSFIILENGYQTYPSAIAGFDAVSTSIRGNDADFVRSGRAEEKGFGKFLHPKMLINLRHSEIVDRSTDNGIDCDCQYCKDVKLDSITKDYWNTLRRQHSLDKWNRLMKDLDGMIQENHVEDASENILEKSRLKIFKELLPAY